MYSFALDKLQGRNLYIQPTVKLFEKLKKSVLSHITFYFKDDDHKPVVFNNETISFTCQLVEIYKKMNLDMITLKTETDDFLHSITENCETLIKQTHTRPQQTLELELLQPK